MFNKALEVDPEFESALVALGKIYVWTGRCGCEIDLPEPERAAELVNQALLLDKTLAEPHELLALIHLANKQNDRAVAAAERAAAIEPNDPIFQNTLALVRNLAGKHEEALASMRKSMRLDPLPHDDILQNLGIILYFVGRPEEAIPSLKKIYERRGWEMTLRFLIASYVAAGRMEEAERQAAYIIQPATLEFLLTKVRPYKFPADVRRVRDDLAKVGVK